MKDIHIDSNPKVQSVFENYPDSVKNKMYELRKLVLEVASETEGLESLEETLKWGEPSYLTKHGSTIRMDWKQKTPDRYALYFQCTSQLVPTFRTIYDSTLAFEGNRAVVFKLDEELPVDTVKHCLSMALTYHKLKHMPLLGQ